HFLAGEQGGNEVGERLSRAGARLHHGVAAVTQGSEDHFRHLDLLGPVLVVGHRPRQPAAGTEDGQDLVAIRQSQSAATGVRVSTKTTTVRATTARRPGESGAALSTGGWPSPTKRRATKNQTSQPTPEKIARARRTWEAIRPTSRARGPKSAYAT